jgi:iron-sulfur cluster assembly accessory protein
MITFTENALTRIRHQCPGVPAGVRLSTESGGCSGTRYVLDIPGVPSEGDRRFDQDGVAILVDATSYPGLVGLEVDFVDSLVGGGFSFKNPNAASSCGCGASFSPLQQLGTL